MSDSAKRCLKTYPNQKIYNEVVQLSEKRGATKSDVIKEALRFYFKEKPFISKLKSHNDF